MADIFAPIKNAMEVLGKLKAISDNIKNAEMRNLIGDLTNSLADLKLEIADLKEQNLSLGQELAAKKKHEEQAAELIVKDGVLYFKEAPAGKPIGPYCPNCKENGKMVLIKDNRGTPFE